MKKSRSGTGKRAARPARDWRRWGRWLTGITLLVLLAVGLAAALNRLADPQVLPLRVVRIDGELRHLQRAEIEAEVGREIRGNFFTLDVRRVREAAERLPWVDWVSVRRIWPDTLRMTVHEQVPLARWGRQRLVNPRGEIFAPGAGRLPRGLTRLSGPDSAAPEVVARYLALRGRFDALGLQLSSLGMDARGAWRVSFGNGLSLALGTGETDRRLERFFRFFPALRREPGRRPLSIDLRYANGFAVRWETVDEPPEGERKAAVQRRLGGAPEQLCRGQV